MTESKECRKIIDKLRDVEWRIEGLSELFCNLKGGDDFHISEGGLYGVSLILEDIKEHIHLSVNSLEKLEYQASKDKT